MSRCDRCGGPMMDGGCPWCDRLDREEWER